MNKYNNISNTELSNYIDEWVRGERNRKLLKRRLIDGVALEPLAEEFNLTADRVKQIVNQERKKFEPHLKTT